MSAHGHVDLGHTAAGWTGTAIALTGLAIVGVAIPAVSAVLAVLGGGVLLLAGLITWGLHLAGWGKPSGPRPEAEWSWKVRDHAARRGHPDCLGCRLAGRRPAAVLSGTAAYEPAGASPSSPVRAEPVANPGTPA
ncbi:HGxxPAAW family protein [Streptomyces sp. NPDC059544]|uniref:HGxxPAAW family protein n=1 Tax=Streptomyces sp. NPDC059544 TaxID=3346861 RepID=UPI00369DFB26